MLSRSHSLAPRAGAAASSSIASSSSQQQQQQQDASSSSPWALPDPNAAALDPQAVCGEMVVVNAAVCDVNLERMLQLVPLAVAENFMQRRCQVLGCYAREYVLHQKICLAHKDATFIDIVTASDLPTNTYVAPFTFMPDVSGKYRWCNCCRKLRLIITELTARHGTTKCCDACLQRAIDYHDSVDIEAGLSHDERRVD